MQKIKVTELFASIQGEARYAGVPSIFLRTYGCNFTCPGFGLPLGQRTSEPDEIAKLVFMSPEKYQRQQDLPLAKKGCDTYISWHPAFKDYSPFQTTRELADNIKALLKGKTFGPDYHLVITGGEPLLGWQRAYAELLDILVAELNLTNVTFETNGTQKLQDAFKTYLFRSDIKWHFSVSPKLSASGEKWEDAILPKVVEKYSQYGIVDLKFVVDSEAGVLEVQKAVAEYNAWGSNVSSVYLMPEGGINEGYQANTRKVADLAMKYGYRYSPRLQNDIYDNSWAT